MDTYKLFNDTGLQALIFVPLVTFFLGIFGSIIVQILLDRRQRHSITYSQKTETPLTVAKKELKDKFIIEYQGTKIEKLYFFNLKIANTGRKMIEKQNFSCKFAEGAKSIDPAFPDIKTHSITPVQVGPINLISQTNSQYSYQIEKISVGQIVEVDFLTIDNSTSDFKVEFDAIDGVKYNQGDVTNIPTLRIHLETLVTNLVVFFLLIQAFYILPFPYLLIGLVSIPFIFFAFRSFRSIIDILTTERYNNLSRRSISTSSIHGDVYQAENISILTTHDKHDEEEI